MRWQAALREYRRSSVEGDMDARAPVMFVLCAECGPAGRLVAALDPAAVLQTFGGVENPEDPAIRATIEYAVRQQGVRSILVCGHTGCRARAEPTREESRAAVVAQCRRLRDDRTIGALLQAHRVVVQPVLFDEAEGDVFLCSYESDRLTLLDDEAFGRLLSTSAVARRT